MTDVAFSPDGELLAAAGGNDHTVLLWDAATGEQLRIMTTCCVVSAVAFSPDGKRLATDGDLFDVTTGELIRELEVSAYDVAFSPNGTVLATASGYDPFLGVRFFDPFSGSLVRVLDQEYAYALAFSPDGELLATASGYLRKGVRLWNPATGELLRTIRGGSDAVAFSQDGELLATSGDGLVRLWNPATGEHLRDIGADVAMSFSQDGELLTVSEQGSVQLYDPSTGRPVQLDANVSANVGSFSPDGERIAVVSPDNSIRVVSTRG